MEPKRLKVVNLIDYLGALQHINIVDGSYDNVILDYYTSVHPNQYDGIDPEMLEKEVTEITLNTEDNIITINIGKRITRAD